MREQYVKEEAANVQELRKENESLIKKACVYTNTAYALIEAADTFILNVDAMLEKVHAQVSREEKQKIKYAIAQGKQFKSRLSSLAKVLYKLEVVDEALDDSDELYSLLGLIVDKCGGDTDILKSIKDVIDKSFESKYGYCKAE